MPRAGLRITCLHGFFGLPSGWDFLAKAGFEPEAPNLYDELAALAEPSLPALGHALSREASGRVLLGYSMGGRVALHALLEAPGRWDAAVIVSAHPGLPDRAMRRERLASDERWALRVERESWPDVVAAWMAQPVFQGQVGPERKEADFDRGKLALAMRSLSLGHQEDLAPRVSSLRIPILWVAGEADTRYATIAQDLHQSCVDGGNQCSRLWIAPEAGHRVPWEAPGRFLARLREFTL